jgi:hypothetical protein
VQTIFGGAPPAPATVRDPNDVVGNTLFYSKEFVRKYFLIWYWATYILLDFIGFDFLVAMFIAFVCLTIGSLTFGLVRAIDDGMKARRARLSAGWQQPAVAAPVRGTSSWHPMVSLPAPSARTGSAEPFVGNLVLGIYHVENCDWVERISSRNRVGFSTASEAISHGFKPCRVCSPAA